MEILFNSRALIIAIDGYSSCGKSTFAKAIAARLGYVFIDTGAMYRAVTLMALRAGCVTDAAGVDVDGVVALLPELSISFAFNEVRGASDILLDGEVVESEIRRMEVSSCVSEIAKIGAVRERLVTLQQSMGCSGGVVMDGRDIGTVVFPAAEIKIFMTADPYVRARRRYDELRAKGEEISMESILDNVVKRDREDESREISPLRRADDALLLDNSQMSVEEQLVWFDDVYNRVLMN